MKITYAITVCNELEEITNLLNFLIKNKRKEDEIVILFDKKKRYSRSMVCPFRIERRK
jgi:hypothetical protein